MRRRSSSTPTRTKAGNLARAERLLRDAAADGADLVVLPEKFNVLGGPDDLRAGAEPIPGPTTDWAAALSRELGLWLVAGSVVERVEGDDKLRNTSVLVGPDGGVHATYRKIHLFDVEVDGMVYRESDVEAVGRRSLRTPAACRSAWRSVTTCASRSCSGSWRFEARVRSHCRRRSPSLPVAHTGRSSCAPARSRTRCS